MAKKQYLDLAGLTTYDGQIKSYIDAGDASTSTKLTSGTIVVKEAQHATSADSATTATNANNATTASKLGSTDVGSATQPIYLKAGVATKVPSVGVAYGGTGATTVAAARTNLDIYSKSEVDSALSGKASSSHNHDTKYDAKGSAATAESNAKAYADTAAATVKNDLLNGAGEAYDTLKELSDLIVDNQDAIEALETVASGKANATHSHAIADVTGLQSALNGKAATSHGTHVSFDSTNKPKMDGTAAFGTATTVSRSDHVHPTDTSRASKTEFDTHVADTTKHITSTERTNWNTAYTHSQAAHAPSNAEKNQNAFSNVKVGTTTVAADTSTDTIELVGSNMTITPDATNDKITFSVATGSTSTAGILKLTNSTSSTSTTTAATPSSVKSAYDLANTAKTNAATAQSTADGAAATASEAKSAAAANTQSISSNTSAISTHTSQISALQSLVGEGFEVITSEQITALFNG